MQIKEIMKRVVTIEPKKTVREAAKLMAAQGLGSLVVVSKGKAVGIVTERDILKFFSKGGKPTTTLGTIMSKDLKVISPNATLNQAAELMARHKIKRLPVVEKGRLVGIVTATDLVAHAEDFDEPFLF